MSFGEVGGEMENPYKRIGFIGAGKMALALMRGLLRSSGRDLNVYFSTRARESGEPFRLICEVAQVTGEWVGDNREIVKQCDRIVIAVKPQIVQEALTGFCDLPGEGKLFLSVAAGITLQQLKSWLPKGCTVVRAMPNMPVRIGQGATAYCSDNELSKDHEEWVRWVLEAAGRCWKVEEAQMDAVTALSGSGPAYVFHFIDALEQAGVALGLQPALARVLALQTVAGSGAMALMEADPEDAEEGCRELLQLANDVKSPGGTTLAGCAVLEENESLRSLMARTLLAARDRAVALREEQRKGMK